MRITLKSLTLGVAAALNLGLGALAAEQAITLGTGGVTGVYYPMGVDICRLVNSGHRQHGTRCVAKSTEGSVYNVGAIRAGELDLGVVQSDVQYNAYHGLDAFKKDGPIQELRALFSVHPEPFTVVVRQDAGIRRFDELQGKRVNIGNPGSGQRATMEAVMRVKGWTPANFALAAELKAAEQSQALCDDVVDAIVYTVGHPNISIHEATTLCDAVLIAVDGPTVEKLVADKPYFAKAVIPGGIYHGTADDVRTFGVKATVVATTATPDETVYWVVKSVFDNFDEFQTLHPALEGLTKASMIQEGNSAPLHPGAERYFKTVGLIE